MAVLLVGYEKPLLKMIQENNPGLLRRFPPEQAFYFDDFDDHELLKILEYRLGKAGLTASVEFKKKASETWRVRRQQSNFGNAGAVDLLVKDATLRATRRARTSPDKHINAKVHLEAVDIAEVGSERRDRTDDPFRKIKKMYGMESVETRLRRLHSAWKTASIEGDAIPSLGHFVPTVEMWFVCFKIRSRYVRSFCWKQLMKAL